MKRKYVILAVLSPSVLILDQLTKRAVIAQFRLAESRPLIRDVFSLTYVRNTGAAFGILRDAQDSFRIPFFVIVPLLAMMAIAYVFRKIGSRDYRISSALSLVIAGALGNLIDRLQLGFVVDFLDFHWKYQYHFPAFNVADMAICVGMATLLLDLFARERETPHVSTAL